MTLKLKGSWLFSYHLSLTLQLSRLKPLQMSCRILIVFLNKARKIINIIEARLCNVAMIQHCKLCSYSSLGKAIEKPITGPMIALIEPVLDPWGPKVLVIGNIPQFFRIYFNYLWSSATEKQMRTRWTAAYREHLLFPTGNPLQVIWNCA